MSQSGPIEVGQLYVIFEARMDPLERDLDNLRRKTKKAGDEAERSVGDKFSRTARRAGAATNDLATRNERLRGIYNRIIVSKERLNAVDLRRARAIQSEITRTEGLIAANRKLAGGGAAGGAMGGVAGMAGGVVTVTAAIGALGTGMRFVIATGAELEKSLSDLSAITGIAGGDLSELKQAAIDTGKELGTGAAAGVEAFKLLASNIDVATLGGVEGLKRLGKEVQVLAKASGVDLATAANVVASTLNQFKISARESDRVVNALAAGAKYGAAEVEDLGKSIKEAGTTAALSGISLETTIGAIEVLSQNAIKGSEAGTGLRNTLTILQSSADKLAKWGIKDVNLQSDGLVKTLEKLKPILKNTAAMADIFGRENLGVASILVQNAAAVETMTEKVTGTKTAMEQAAIQTDNLSGDVEKLKATFQGIASSLYDDLNPALRATIQLFDTLLNTMARKKDIERQFGVDVSTAIARAMGMPAVRWDASHYNQTGQFRPYGAPSGGGGSSYAGKSYSQQGNASDLAIQARMRREAEALAAALEEQAAAEEKLRQTRAAAIKSIQDSMAAAFTSAEERTKLFGNEIGEIEDKLKAAGKAMNQLLDTGFVQAQSAEIRRLSAEIKRLMAEMEAHRNRAVSAGGTGGSQIPKADTSAKGMMLDSNMKSAREMLDFYQTKMPEAISATAKAQKMLSDLTEDYFGNVLVNATNESLNAFSLMIGQSITGVQSLSDAFQAFRDRMRNIMAELIAAAVKYAVVWGTIKILGGPATNAGSFLAAATGFNFPAKMASGGVVPSGFPNDSFPALLSSGETVVPKRFSESPIARGGSRGGATRVVVEGRISGSDLELVLARRQRRNFTFNGGARF